MSLAGGVAILAGWLMIIPFRRMAGVRKYLLAVGGVSILAGGMFAVIQGRF